MGFPNRQSYESYFLYHIKMTFPLTNTLSETVTFTATFLSSTKNSNDACSGSYTVLPQMGKGFTANKVAWNLDTTNILILCILDSASSWYLNKGRPIWWHLFYYVNLPLNMFWMLIHPFSGVCDYLVRYCVRCIVLTWGVLVLCSGIGCWWCGIRVQAELGYHITNNQSAT